MNTENTDEQNERDETLAADENVETIYKSDDESPEETDKPAVGDPSNSADTSKFKDTPQDLKDGTSQE